MAGDSYKSSVAELLGLLFRPALSPALAAFFGLVIIGLSFMWFSSREDVEKTDAGTNKVAVEKEPEPARQKAVVRFVFYSPNARQVELIGGFNGWKAGASPMTDINGDGLWVTTVTLPPGEHEYQFIIDGKERIADPLASVVKPDGFGGRNSVLAL